MVKLSVIIPIYKVENYIIECLESICCQLIEGVEVILVNDGTPDNSMLLARSYISERYSNFCKQFIFIDQENQGQSVARNNGIKIAQGEYITFLDSDDLVSSGYFSTIFTVLLDSEVDIIQFKSFKFENNIKNKYDFNVNIEAVGSFYNNKSLMLELFSKCAWFPWMNVYRTTLFLNEKFPEGFYFEDADLMPKIFFKAKKIHFIDNRLYFYRDNNNGSLKGKSAENLEKIKNSYHNIVLVYLNRLQDDELYSAAYISMVVKYLVFLVKRKNFSDLFKQYSNVDLTHVNKKLLMRGNKLFYNFGILYIAVLVVLKGNTL